MNDFSALPSVEALSQEFAAEAGLPRPLLTEFIRREIEAARARLLAGETFTREELTPLIAEKAALFAASRLQPVINATGVLIHTNLGRSPLGPAAAAALAKLATGYCNVELDLATGSRGPRAAFLETAIACLLAAPAATTVNNCAAALVLTLRTLISGEKNEVLVSRSELVEIGGGFRIPDILETSGARLREVGTTNKTRLQDYRNALSPQTALILKVHRSNFFLGGFTGEPSLPELAALARKIGLPLIEDLGSGALMATDELAPLDHEPTPQESLKAGVDLVLFSGDKLLGGPQSGIIAGRADLVAAVKNDPFFRAVRCDKLILATLQECVETYLRADLRPPVLEFLATPVSELRARAEKIHAALGHHPSISIQSSTARTGGGTMPKSEIPSVSLVLTPEKTSAQKLAAALRTASPERRSGCMPAEASGEGRVSPDLSSPRLPVVGHLSENRLHLDLRTVFPAQDAALTTSLRAILED